MRILAELLAASMFQIGQILDSPDRNSYQLIEPLKLTGMRQTWRSIDLTSQTACIIKLLGFHPTLQWQDYERLQQEIKLLKSLKCDRIPRYLADFVFELDAVEFHATESSATHWVVLVQEEIPGKSLQTLLEQNDRLTEADIRQIAIELLQILTELQGEYPPVVHRTIQPSHVILTPERSVYLVDFGAARVGFGTVQEIADFTVPGAAGYVPLEQLVGRAVPASDLYAVGATVAHLFTGVCPADLLPDQLSLLLRSFLSIDDRFANWLEKMLQPNIEQRFQTAKQALAALLGKDSQESAIELTAKNSNDLVSVNEPIGERIKIYAAANRLQVNIGRRGVRLADALWLGTGVLTGGVSGLMFLSHVHPLLSLLCWLDSLPLLGIGLISALGEASLILNDRSLLIEWKCLEIPYWRVKSSAVLAIDSATSGITIQTENRQHSIGQFSPELSETESMGLVQEVRGWMGGWVDG